MRTESKKRNIPLLVKMAEAGVNATDLAAKSGISKATLSRLLCQRCDASAETLKRLSKILGCNPADLVPANRGGVPC